VKDKHRQIDEGLKRGGRAIGPAAQPPEALEPTDAAFDGVVFR
jgi:hypothetical protein